MPSKSLHTQTLIQAPPQRVWEVFSDFQSYQKWQTFLKIEGSADMKPGDRLKVNLTPKDASPVSFNTELLKWTPNEELRWRGKVLGSNWFFVGEHFFQLEAQADGSTLFKHGEHFTGLLLPVLGGMLKKTEGEFENFNSCLKKKVEGR